MNEESKLDAAKTIEWYDANAESYTEKTLARARMDQIKAFVDLLPNYAKVLDVGCGPGRDTALLAERGCEVTGIDLSKGLITEARKRYPQLQFDIGSMTALPYSKDTFDGIWANASLLHLPTLADVQQTLKEFSRVLKPSGSVHISVKAQLSDAQTEVVTDELSGAKRFFRYFKKDALVQLLHEAGFEIITIEQFNEATLQLTVARSEVEWIVVMAKRIE